MFLNEFISLGRDFWNFFFWPEKMNLLAGISAILKEELTLRIEVKHRLWTETQVPESLMNTIYLIYLSLAGYLWAAVLWVNKHNLYWWISVG